MAQFPTTESDVQTLAQTMSAGLAAHPTDFPNVDAASLATANTEYATAKAEFESAKAAYHQATARKNGALANLRSLMRSGLSQAEIDTAWEPQKLYEIGWGPKAEPTPLTAPGQPTDFVAVLQGPGSITFKWKKPISGGKVSSYLIYRRYAVEDQEPGQWQQVSTAMYPDCQLAGQPTGTTLDYCVTAINTAGESIESNTVRCVL